MAAQEGRSLKELFTVALRRHLDSSQESVPGQEAWRRVFGKAAAEEVRAVDEIVAEDLEQVELENWS